MGGSRFPRWRKRTWAFITWTGVVVAGGVVAPDPFLTSKHPCPTLDFSCGIEAHSHLVFIVLLFVAWLIGLGLGFGLIWLVARHAERRRLKPLTMKREEMHIKL